MFFCLFPIIVTSRTSVPTSDFSPLGSLKTSPAVRTYGHRAVCTEFRDSERDAVSAEFRTVGKIKVDVKTCIRFVCFLKKQNYVMCGLKSLCMILV